jgi:GDPmannose 4,6-dehydratase
MKKALITGITGMDGSHLTELLLSKGYEVHGIVRRSSSFNTGRIEHLLRDPSIKLKKLFLHYGDLTDGTNISRLIREIRPEECYNLGAQSHVGISFEIPEYSANVDGLGGIRLLDAVRTFCPDCRYYNAATSELFGKVQEVPQNESTPFHPRSPYGAAKLYAYWVTANYREAYGIHASNGILFNHEGERRGENFVTRKITRSAGRIKHGLQDRLCLGNLSARRDWGYAPDYVEAMWLMLQQDKPDDYVIATGEMHSVEEFCLYAFAEVGINLTFEGVDEDRVGFDEDGKVLVSVDPVYFRPADVEQLLGDASKAKRVLGWEPNIKFENLVKLMAAHDLKLAKQEKLLQEI